LEIGKPIEYERDQLDAAIDYLAQFPQAGIARELRISERAWRSIVKGAAQPRSATAETIARLAARRQADQA
jgi:hypothetical protein